MKSLSDCLSSVKDLPKSVNMQKASEILRCQKIADIPLINIVKAVLIGLFDVILTFISAKLIAGIIKSFSSFVPAKLRKVTEVLGMLVLAVGFAILLTKLMKKLMDTFIVDEA